MKSKSPVSSRWAISRLYSYLSWPVSALIDFQMKMQWRHHTSLTPDSFRSLSLTFTNARADATNTTSCGHPSWTQTPHCCAVYCHRTDGTWPRPGVHTTSVHMCSEQQCSQRPKRRSHPNAYQLVNGQIKCNIYIHGIFLNNKKHWYTLRHQWILKTLC